MKVGYDKGRCCDECGIKLAPYLPRTRVGDQLVCGSCLVIMGNLITEGMKTIKVAHEAPGDSDLVFHCFSGDTRYVTRDGLKTFSETVGTIQTVLTADRNSKAGRWVEAPILSFGEQEIWEVRLTRNRQRRVVRTTSGHRWLRRQGGTSFSERTTENLVSGDRLATALPPVVHGLEPSDESIRHGVIFGDGTRTGSGGNTSTVILWGDKDKQLLRFFENVEGFKGSPTMTDNGVSGIRVCANLPGNFKEVPNTDDLHYLYGWLSGYFAADGDVTKEGQVCLSSASYSHLEAVQDVALRLGIPTYGITSKMRRGYNGWSLLHGLTFFHHGLTEEFFLIEEHRDRFVFNEQNGQTRSGWVVESVSPTGVLEEVFCPSVPDTESFVLEGWLHTLNCPFDGSGKIVGQSDGTIFCDYCKRTFTIKEEPEYSAMPQTIDGQPYDAQEVPLPTLDDVEEDSTDEFGDAGMAEDNNEEELDTATDEIFITSSGDIVNEDEYIRSLANRFFERSVRGKSGAGS